MAKRKKPEEELPRVHKDLKGFKIEVDAFGQIKMNRSREDIGQFLSEHLEEDGRLPTADGLEGDGGRRTDDRREKTEE